MFNFIKKLFNNGNERGIHNDKINYILNLDLDPYKSSLNTLNITTIEKDIVTSIKILRIINNSNKVNDNLYVKPITKNSFINKRFIEWYTDNGYIVSKDILNIWLMEVDYFIKEMEEYSKTRNNMSMSNNRLLKPYYTELNGIITDIWVHLKKL